MDDTGNEAINTSGAIVDATSRDLATVERWRRRLNDLGYLYRYRSLTHLDCVEETILRSMIFFPEIPRLNDPFDGRVQVDFDATPDRIRAFWEAYLREAGQPVDEAVRTRIQGFIDGRDDPAVHEQLRGIHQEEINKLGVVCFSEPADDIPMWAYYAGSQEGVCLRFRAPLLVGWRGCFPPLRVDYVKDYPRCGFYRDSRFRRMRAVLATKAKAWKHEREWRMVRSVGGVHHQFDPAALDGVIMGCRISKENEARVRDMIEQRRPRIALLKAQPARRAFKLEIVAA